MASGIYLSSTLVERVAGSGSCLWEQERETAYTSADRGNGKVGLEPGLAMRLGQHIAILFLQLGATFEGSPISQNSTTRWEWCKQPSPWICGRNPWEEPVGGACGRSPWEGLVRGAQGAARGRTFTLKPWQWPKEKPTGYSSTCLSKTTTGAAVWCVRSSPTPLSPLRWSRHRNNAQQVDTHGPASTRRDYDTVKTVGTEPWRVAGLCQARGWRAAEKHGEGGGVSVLKQGILECSKAGHKADYLKQQWFKICLATHHLKAQLEF